MNDLLKNRLLLKRKLADINITKFNFHSENQISEKTVWAWLINLSKMMIPLKTSIL